MDRRSFLRTGLAAGTGLGLAGCLGGSSGSEIVSVLSAGSLAVLFDETVGPAFESETGHSYRGEFHGSNTVMRMVTDEQKRPDVVVSADAYLLRDKLLPEYAAWDVGFASNAVGITYAEGTEIADRLDAGDPWYEVLLETDAEIARSDPDLDPLGYRTVQLFKLAERYYDVSNLTDRLTEKLVVDPDEAHLLAGVETADRAAAICYKNMAIDHGLPFVSLPAELDFSNPALADHYAQATYTTEDGETIQGTPVLYNATVPKSAERPELGRQFVAFLLSHPELLSDNGLVVSDRFPVENGDVPREVIP
jgi:molybdate/tungstate transport system substrate-binding protein